MILRAGMRVRDYIATNVRGVNYDAGTIVTILEPSVFHPNDWVCQYGCAEGSVIHWPGNVVLAMIEHMDPLEFAALNTGVEA